MGTNLPRDKHKKTLVVAIGVSILAGAATMFVPTYILERITGVTGLSELVPATAAPLGDKARALIAFGTGALTLAICALWFFRREEDYRDEFSFPADRAAEAEAQDHTKVTEMMKNERLTAIKDRISNFNLPKMPWVKADNDIRDLADLPNVRAADSHPDAPPRHPLSVTREIDRAAPEASQVVDEIEASLAEEDKAPTMSEAEETVPSVVETPTSPLVDKAADADAAAAPRFEAGRTNEQTAVGTGPSLAEMIGQLEDSMKSRQEQLAQLELISSQIAAEKKAAGETGPMIAKGDEARAEGRAEQAEDAKQDDQQRTRPVLEEVKSDNTDAEEVDSALNAALETLQRMNAQSR